MQQKGQQQEPPSHEVASSSHKVNQDDDSRRDLGALPARPASLAQSGGGTRGSALVSVSGSQLAPIQLALQRQKQAHQRHFKHLQQAIRIQLQQQQLQKRKQQQQPRLTHAKRIDLAKDSPSSLVKIRLPNDDSLDQAKSPSFQVSVCH